MGRKKKYVFRKRSNIVVHKKIVSIINSKNYKLKEIGNQNGFALLEIILDKLVKRK